MKLLENHFKLIDFRKNSRRIPGDVAPVSDVALCLKDEGDVAQGLGRRRPCLLAISPVRVTSLLSLHDRAKSPGVLRVDKKQKFKKMKPIDI